MRDIRKDKNYFKYFLEQKEESISKSIKRIESDKIIKNRVDVVRIRVIGYSIQALIARYSLGETIVSLNKYYSDVIKLMEKFWVVGYSRATDNSSNNSIKYNHYYMSMYIQILDLLSLGYLFNISVDNFSKLVKLIDEDKLKDYLYEFIILSKIKSRFLFHHEGYQKYFAIPIRYRRLRQAMIEPDKYFAAKLVKDFLEKDFYNIEYGLKDNHKLEGPLYYGYWSFEAAAIVQIKGIPDETFRDNEFYPKDLVTKPPSLDLDITSQISLF